MNKILKTLFIVLAISFFNIALGATGTIDSTNKYAWGENLGWINFAPRDSSNNYVGLTITDSAITGYAWSSLYGWVNFSPTNSGQGVTNTTSGTLGGSAWSEQLGWIDMTGVSINSSGTFTGTAGTADTNGGRIKFDCTNCNVSTTWRPSSSGSGSGGGSSGNSSGGSNTSGGSGFISDYTNGIVNYFKNNDNKAQVNDSVQDKNLYTNSNTSDKNLNGENKIDKGSDNNTSGGSNNITNKNNVTEQGTFSYIKTNIKENIGKYSALLSLIILGIIVMVIVK
jgi:hypothetical protein